MRYLFVVLVFLFPVMADAGGIPTDCESNSRQDCVMYGDPNLGLLKPVEKQKKLVRAEGRSVKVEHKDKLLKQCAAEREIIAKLTDEIRTIKKLHAQLVEALYNEISQGH